MSSALLGVVGIAIATFFYGTNYVPVKKYRTYDGILFQWYQSSGTATVGLILAIVIDWNFGSGLQVPWEGLTGGLIYSVVVALFPMVCKMSGLAVGFVSWTGASIVMGWAVGRFGLWGVTAQSAKYPMLDIISVILCVMAIFCMLFVKPEKKIEEIKSKTKMTIMEKMKIENQRKEIKKLRKEKKKHKKQKNEKNTAREQTSKQNKEQQSRKAESRHIVIKNNNKHSTKFDFNRAVDKKEAVSKHLGLGSSLDDDLPQLTRLGPVTPQTGATPRSMTMTQEHEAKDESHEVHHNGGETETENENENETNHHTSNCTSNQSEYQSDDCSCSSEKESESDSESSDEFETRMKQNQKQRRSSYTDYEALVLNHNNNSQSNLFSRKHLLKENVPLAYISFGTFLDYKQVAIEKVRQDKTSIIHSLDLRHNSRVTSNSASTKGNDTEKRDKKYKNKLLNNASIIDIGDETQRLKEKKKENKFGKCATLIGSVLAVLQGTISGNVNAFYLLWAEKNDISTLNYCFSYYLGIYLGATFMFLIMGLWKKANRKSWKKPVVRPAFLSGAMYGIGYAGLLFSAKYLGFPVVFVACNVGAIMVSNLWSIFYFKEIQSPKSLKILSVAIFIMVVGIVAEAIAS